jgi:hypothetical protein
MMVGDSCDDCLLTPTKTVCNNKVATTLYSTAVAPSNFGEKCGATQTVGIHC